MSPGAPTPIRTLVGVGIGLALGLATEAVILALLRPDWAAAAGAGALAEVFTGREGGIPIGLGQGAPPWLVFQVSVTQDLAAFFLAYPLFVGLLRRNKGRDNLLMREVRRIEANAARHEKYVKRWGPLGIFLFMLAPFLINGPLVGGMLGRLGGIPTRWILPPVIASTVIAAAAWTFAYESLITWLDSIDPVIATLFPFTVFGVLFLLVVWGLVSEARRRRAEHKLGASADEEE